MSNKLKRRLEVATELRQLGETGSVAEYLDKPIRYQMGFRAIKAVLGKGDCFELLADLIEPDTCVMSFVEEEAMQATYQVLELPQHRRHVGALWLPIPVLPLLRRESQDGR